MLGIGKDADKKAIKDAFRTLALKYHPDRNREAGAEEKFKEIAEAYAVLSDPKKRKEYDERGFAAVSGFSQEDLFSGINFDEIFGGSGFGFDLGGFGGGLFEGLFRRGGQHDTRGEDIRVELLVPLQKIVTGGDAEVQISHERSCPLCHGTGAASESDIRPCKSCNGTGRVINTRRENSVAYQEIRRCPECGGRGKFIDKPCPKCRGTGVIDEPERLTVTIPVGAEEGMVLRIAGHGRPGSKPEGEPGDLLIIVRTAYDQNFKRAGADLWHTRTIGLLDAVLGEEIEIPTVEGRVKVKVPQGTQPNGVLRLAAKGLPHFGEARRGDLYLRLNVHIPEHISDEERELYRRLQRLSRER